MNNALTGIKNTLEGTNSRISEAEDTISEVEDRMVGISEAEWRRRIKKKQDYLRDLQDNIQCLNSGIIEVPEEEDKKKGHKKILKR